MNLSVGPTAQKEVPGGGRKQETAFFFFANDKEQKSVKEHDLGQYSCFAKVCVSYRSNCQAVLWAVEMQLCYCPQLSLMRACIDH